MKCVFSIFVVHGIKCNRRIHGVRQCHCVSLQVVFVLLLREQGLNFRLLVASTLKIVWGDAFVLLLHMINQVGALSAFVVRSPTHIGFFFR